MGCDLICLTVAWQQKSTTVQNKPKQMGEKMFLFSFLMGAIPIKPILTVTNAQIQTYYTRISCEMARNEKTLSKKLIKKTGIKRLLKKNYTITMIISSSITLFLQRASIIMFTQIMVMLNCFNNLLLETLFCFGFIFALTDNLWLSN